MSTESLKPPVDHPTIVLQSIIGSSEIRKQLITNGDKKADILERSETLIDAFDPEETRTFLRKSFAVLGDRDDSQKAQDKRDAILEILPIVDLRKIDPTQLTQDYLTEVYKLNRDSDPFGEAHALAEAGKTIAYRIRAVPGNKTEVTTAWNQVASNFVEAGYIHVLNRIEEIEQQMVLKSSDFYKKAKGLREKGLTYEEITETLHASEHQVRRVLRQQET